MRSLNKLSFGFQIALKLAAIQEAFKQAGTLAAAAAAATATTAVPTQCDADSNEIVTDDGTSDNPNNIDDVTSRKSSIQRKFSFSPRLSTGESQAAALALAGAAVSQAGAALLPNSCQNSAEQQIAKSLTTHDSPGTYWFKVCTALWWQSVKTLTCC